MEVITAKTIANRDGCKTVREFIQKIAARRGIKIPLTIAEGEGAEVIARIDNGRWIADCECNGAEYVDPDEPVFWCFSCNNRHHGLLRPVKFPPADTRQRIEASLKPETFNSWNEQEEPYGV